MDFSPGGVYPLLIEKKERMILIKKLNVLFLSLLLGLTLLAAPLTPPCPPDPPAPPAIDGAGETEEPLLPMDVPGNKDDRATDK